MSLFEAVNAINATLVAESFGLAKARERNKAACPACPSTDGLHAYPDNGQQQGRGFYCWACDTGMSNVDLVMALDGCDKLVAAKELAARFNIPIDDAPQARYFDRRRAPQGQPIPTPTPTPKRPLEAIWRSLTLGEQGSTYLHHDRAIHYLCAHDMGVRSVETRQQLDDLMGILTPDERIAIGLEREEDGRRRRVVWDVPFLVLPYLEPCQPHEGAHGPERIETLRFAPFGEYRARYPKLKYLSLYERRPMIPYAAWQIESARLSGQRLIVVEGELNALSLQQHGCATIATAGAHGWQESWLDLMGDLAGLTLVCDGDRAGQQWADTIRAQVTERMGFYEAQQWLRVIPMAEGDDINDLSQRGELAAWIADQGV